MILFIIVVLAFSLSGCGKETEYDNVSLSLNLNTVIGTDDGERVIIGMVCQQFFGQKL